MHFFIAASIVFTSSAAFALFLEAYETQGLPYLYLATAVTVSLLSFAYLRFTRRAALTRLVTFNLVFLTVGCVAFRLGIAFLGAAALAFILPIWYQILNNLGNLTLWTLAGHLFDVRQGKRLFGLVNAGAWVASAVTGFLVSPLVGLVGTANLFILAAVGMAAALIVASMLTREYGDRLNITQTRLSDDSAQPRESLASLIRVRYIALVFLMLMLWWIGYFFIDNIFYDRATIQYPDTDRMAAFLGMFFGAVGILGLLVDLFVTSRVVSRYGLRGAYLIMPVIVSACAAGIAITSAMGGAVSLMFSLAVLAKLMNVGLGSSIEQSSYAIFFQPLPAEQQVRVRTVADGIVQPIAVGMAGILLLIFNTTLGFDAVELSVIFLGFAAAWIAVLILLTREYPAMLMRALAKRRLATAESMIGDRASISVLEQGLRNPHPAAVIYALNLLEQIEYPALASALTALLDHPSAQVRQEAIERIERLHIASAADAIRQRISLESAPQVKGAALRALLVLSEHEAIDDMVSLLDSDPIVRRGIVAGWLRSGNLEYLIVGAQTLVALVNAPTPDERSLAAHILGDVGAHNVYQSLLPLLRDDDLTVRRAALIAAGKIKHPRTWSALIGALTLPETRHTAASAIISAGNTFLPQIEKIFDNTDDISRDVLVRLARIAGRIGGDEVIACFQNHLAFPDAEARGYILGALSASGYCAANHGVEHVQRQIKTEIGYAAWILAALDDLGRGDQVALLKNALHDQLRQFKERLFYLLTFVYHPPTIKRAREALIYGSPTQRAYALEVLDTLLAQDLRVHILPLLEDLSPDDQLYRLSADFPQQRMNRPTRLNAIIRADYAWLSPWTRACALYTAGLLWLKACEEAVRSAVNAPEPVVRETALWARGRIAFSGEDSVRLKLTQPSKWNDRSDRRKAGHAMLSTIEKVIILKTVGIFAETPDEALTEIATILQELIIKPDETIFEKGDVGTSMYIIVHGKVRIHDGDSTLNTLGENDVFGELALLDPEPRIASVTAVEDTHLFKLEQEPFYDLMTDRGEVARGIIRTLVRSLRARAGVTRA